MGVVVYKPNSTVMGVVCQETKSPFDFLAVDIALFES